VRKSKLSGADRLAGMAAGLVKGALFSILIVFLLVILLPRDARLLRESESGPRQSPPEIGSRPSSPSGSRNRSAKRCGLYHPGK